MSLIISEKLSWLCEQPGVDSAVFFRHDGELLARSDSSILDDSVYREIAVKITTLLDAGELSVTNTNEISLTFELKSIYAALIATGMLVVIHSADTKIANLRVTSKILKKSLLASPATETVVPPTLSVTAPVSPVPTEPPPSVAPAKKTKLGIWD